jgi:hypothetical protein
MCKEMLIISVDRVADKKNEGPRRRRGTRGH